MLTRKQLELLLFINERLKESGVPPSFDEMKDALDLRSKSGIHRLITALEERGFGLSSVARETGRLARAGREAHHEAGAAVQGKLLHERLQGDLRAAPAPELQPRDQDQATGVEAPLGLALQQLRHGQGRQSGHADGLETGSVDTSGEGQLQLRPACQHAQCQHVISPFCPRSW